MDTNTKLSQLVNYLNESCGEDLFSYSDFRDSSYSLNYTKNSKLSVIGSTYGEVLSLFYPCDTENQSIPNLLDKPLEDIRQGMADILRNKYQEYLRSYEENITKYEYALVQFTDFRILTKNKKILVKRDQDGQKDIWSFHYVHDELKKLFLGTNLYLGKNSKGRVQHIFMKGDEGPILSLNLNISDQTIATVLWESHTRQSSEALSIGFDKKSPKDYYGSHVMSHDLLDLMIYSMNLVSRVSVNRYFDSRIVEELLTKLS